MQMLKTDLVWAHQMLFSYKLVKWTMGNVSVRASEDSVLIKPSGVHYHELTEENMVLVDLFGKPLEPNQAKPSTDAESHCAIYRQWKGEPIGAIVHTHSPYATAFAARGFDIPCVLTSIADEFGGDIPCAEYATIGGEQIAEAVLEELNLRYCPAVLLKSHGVFTFGPTLEAAVKAAIMVEDAAHIVWMASRLPEFPLIHRLPETEIDLAHTRYTHDYGQTK